MNATSSVFDRTRHGSQSTSFSHDTNSVFSRVFPAVPPPPRRRKNVKSMTATSVLSWMPPSDYGDNDAQSEYNKNWRRGNDRGNGSGSTAATVFSCRSRSQPPPPPPRRKSSKARTPPSSPCKPSSDQKVEKETNATAEVTTPPRPQNKALTLPSHLRTSSRSNTTTTISNTKTRLTRVVSIRRRAGSYPEDFDSDNTATNNENILCTLPQDNKNAENKNHTAHSKLDSETKAISESHDVAISHMRKNPLQLLEGTLPRLKTTSESVRPSMTDSPISSSLLLKFSKGNQDVGNSTQDDTIATGLLSADQSQLLIRRGHSTGSAATHLEGIHDERNKNKLDFKDDTDALLTRFNSIMLDADRCINDMMKKKRSSQERASTKKFCKSESDLGSECSPCQLDRIRASRTRPSYVLSRSASFKQNLPNSQMIHENSDNALFCKSDNLFLCGEIRSFGSAASSSSEEKEARQERISSASTANSNIGFCRAQTALVDAMEKSGSTACFVPVDGPSNRKRSANAKGSRSRSPIVNANRTSSPPAINPKSCDVLRNNCGEEMDEPVKTRSSSEDLGAKNIVQLRSRSKSPSQSIARRKRIPSSKYVDQPTAYNDNKSSLQFISSTAAITNLQQLQEEVMRIINNDTCSTSLPSLTSSLSGSDSNNSRCSIPGAIIEYSNNNINNLSPVETEIRPRQSSGNLRRSRRREKGKDRHRSPPHLAASSLDIETRVSPKSAETPRRSKSKKSRRSKSKTKSSNKDHNDSEAIMAINSPFNPMTGRCKYHTEVCMAFKDKSVDDTIVSGWKLSDQGVQNAYTNNTLLTWRGIQ
mmetsp:Transcript_34155/g.71905  ORF Transcript_34155/g.71905 Transcript_34155/m.71905 type:complete len:819 (+) Transcript_34155:283-2739(+)